MVLTSGRAGTAARPDLAHGVELLGPYLDSGLEHPPYLVRRAGRIVQVSRLLHTVAAGADGTRTYDEMAAVAGAELDRPLSGDDVRYLVCEKLAPAGIVTVDGAAPPPPPAADQRLLALRFRRSLIPPPRMDAWARRFAPLFRAPAVAGVLAGVVGLDFWLFAIRGTGTGMDEVARTPALVALVLAVICASGAFHEIGHAAGCRYSGGRSGGAGIGLYFCWPVMFTNVTDAYRLDRRGRLRTDLGGIYFNAVVILALGAAYGATGHEVFLALIVIEHLLVAYQLIPFVRLDGFYVVSDLTGVPDILSRIRPALASLIPGRPPHPAVAALRPSARRLLFAYLVALVLFLALVVMPAILSIPSALAAARESLSPHLHDLRAAAGRWDTVMVFVHAVATALLALPIVGLLLTAGLFARRLFGGPVRALRSRRRGEPIQRWLASSGLEVVEAFGLPDGGVIDYAGFGRHGEIVLFASAVDRPVRDAVGRLRAAAAQLSSSPSEIDLVVLISRRRRLAAVTL